MHDGDDEKNQDRATSVVFKVRPGVKDEDEDEDKDEPLGMEKINLKLAL